LDVVEVDGVGALADVRDGFVVERVAAGRRVAGVGEWDFGDRQVVGPVAGAVGGALLEAFLQGPDPVENVAVPLGRVGRNAGPGWSRIDRRPATVRSSWSGCSPPKVGSCLVAGSAIQLPAKQSA
jgi:hypothetical protein